MAGYGARGLDGAHGVRQMVGADVRGIRAATERQKPACTGTGNRRDADAERTGDLYGAPAKTATETFEEIRDFFETPALANYVAEIRSALGREAIILRSGARVKFLARTRTGGRGQHGDLLIIDEAQEMDENQQASFLPAISASKNPQTIYVGTPPEPDSPGTVFRSIRERAMSKDSKKTAWFEFSVPEIGDVKDPERWAKTNPALGRRIMLSTIEGEAEQMDADTFARERLGWWTPIVEHKLDMALDPAAWTACSSDEKSRRGKLHTA